MSDNILHYAAYKIRVRGSGVLRSTIKGMDSVVTFDFVNFNMSNNPAYEITGLCDLVSQRATVKFYTTGIDETFNVNRLTVFQKPLWTSIPQ